ncbi:MAG: transglycosylase domain-containing protein [Candidatus Gracilibacteria bacterium]|nr:transglycosylase domain-containing protein [Candidatus Gracilibacteria bacterium]
MKKSIKITLISIIFLYVIYFTFPYFIKIDLKEIPESKVIYDSNNEEIGEIIAENKYRHRIGDFSGEKYDFAKKVFISLEDKRFYYHSGIDFISFFRAFYHDLLAGKIVEGASTIDSQVIRNSLWLNSSRGYKTKIKEFVLALALNKKYSKDEILNLYLNNIYFGYLNYGLESASIYYFGKDVTNLTKAEIIALATIPKNSNNYEPFKKKQNFENRFSAILEALKSRKIITESEYEDIKSEKLIWNTEHKNKLPYVVDFIEKTPPASLPPQVERGTEGEGKIQTTLDYYMTREIEKLSYNAILKLFWKNVTDYSVIVLDRKTNDLKVMIGGIDYAGLNGQVNSRTSPRQAGSAIKPFTYYLAFKNLGLSPESKILDLPISFQTKEGYEYSPKNYDLKYHSEVSLAEALSQSINIPAVKLTQEIGVENLLEFLKKVGITSLNESAEHYGLALTLGVGEVSLYELTRAYSIFANNGDLCDINFIEGNNKKCSKIAEKKYSDMVSEILTNRYFKLGGFPINSSLDFPDRNVFVKTGTSRNFRDNWAMGYTDNYIIGVWVGNKDASNMKGVSGASGAGEVFRNIVYYLEPTDIVETKYFSNNKENRNENIRSLQEKYLEITSPLQNSVYSIDKQKPLDSQSIKIEFSTNYDYDKVYYLVDNEILKNEFWKLEKGTHKIFVKLMQNGSLISTKKTLISVE